MTDSQFLRHLARAPVGRAVFGSAARAVQDLSLQCGTLCLNLSALMTSVESSQAFDLVTFQPKSDGIDAAAHLPGHGSLSLTFGQSQKDVGAADVFGGKTAATQLRLQFGFIGDTHHKPDCHGQDHSKAVYQKSMLQRTSAFPITHWSIVLAASADDFARATAALERLCRTYWYPIYAFIRRRGSQQHDAEDLTQAFFAFLLERDTLKKVNRTKGKFRTFLLAALANFLANEWDKSRTLKRGGQRQLISLDETVAEELYRHEAVESLTPEKLLERRWAKALIEQVLARLQQEYAAGGKA